MVNRKKGFAMNMSIDLKKLRETAEAYYRNGDFYCSEAIVKAIRDAFDLSLPDSVIAMASGFPVGMGGAGCTCGAVAGGIMSLGMCFGRTKAGDKRVNKVMEGTARPLPETAQAPVLQDTDKGHDPRITGTHGAMYRFYRGDSRRDRPDHTQRTPSKSNSNTGQLSRQEMVAKGFSYRINEVINKGHRPAL